MSPPAKEKLTLYPKGSAPRNCNPDSSSPSTGSTPKGSRSRSPKPSPKSSPNSSRSAPKSAARSSPKIRAKARDGSVTPKIRSARNNKEGRVAARATSPVPAAQLHARASQIRERAEALSKDAIDGSLGVRLLEKVEELMEARVIATHAEAAKQLFRSWDKNNDGKFSKLEFRNALRGMQLVGTANEVPSVDALFASLDVDAGGTLDVGELTSGLAQLHAQRHAKSGGNAAQLERLQAHAVLCDRAAVAAEALEAAKAAVAAAIENTGVSVGTRCAVALAKKQLKPTDLLASATSWDTNGDGKLVAAEMVAGLRAIGVEATDEELSQLIGSLETDANGAFGLDHVKAAFKCFTSEKTAYDDALKALKTAAENARRMATHELQVLHDLEAADAAAEEARAAEAAEREAAAAEAAAAADAAATAKAAERRAEKDAFEERVAMKREQSSNMRSQAEQIANEQRAEAQAAANEARANFVGAPAEPMS